MLEETGNEELGGADQEDTGNNAITPDGQEDSTDGADQNENQNEVAGLKAAAAAEREKRQAAEAEAQSIKDQMAVVMANQNTSQNPQAEPTQADILKQLGVEVEDDDDYLTAGQMKTVLQGFAGQVNSIVSNQTFLSKRSDFADVVGVQVGNNFQYAPPMLRALKANPALSSILQQSPNAAVLAYEIAKNDPEYLASQEQAGKTTQQIAAEKAEAKIKVANKQQSISAAKGGGEPDQGAAITAMSDKEFEIHNLKIMEKA